MGFLEWKKARQQFEIAYKDMNKKLGEIGLKEVAETAEERSNYIAKLQNHFSVKTQD